MRRDHVVQGHETRLAPLSRTAREQRLVGRPQHQVDLELRAQRGQREEGDVVVEGVPGGLGVGGRVVEVAEFEGRRQSDGGQRVVLALGECLGALFLGETVKQSFL